MTLSPGAVSFFSGSKFGNQYFGLFDVGFLGGLVASTEKYDQAFALLNKIDSVAGPPIYSVLAQTFEPLDVGRIAELQSNQRIGYFKRGLRIQGGKPASEGACFIVLQVFFECDHRRL
jgi:hypothetical protein